MNIPEIKQFGELVRLFRMRQKLTQEALGNKIGRSRPSISAWENGSLPDHPEIVEALAKTLQLPEDETDFLLLAAHFPQKYGTQGMPVPPDMLKDHLHLVNIYIRETSDTPLIEITLHNKGTYTVLPTHVQVEILDVGTFCYCDEDENDDGLIRSPIPSSGTYDVQLSPTSKGKCLTTKIVHQLRVDEPDYFKLRVNQDEAGWSLPYVWYYLKITILYDEPARALEGKPILLSLPPIGDDVEDIWYPSHNSCSAQNRAMLQRMDGLEAQRSASVDTIIKQILEA